MSTPDRRVTLAGRITPTMTRVCTRIGTGSRVVVFADTRDAAFRRLTEITTAR